MQLTVEQIEEFNTRGALIARGALAHADQQPLIDELRSGSISAPRPSAKKATGFPIP